MPTYSDTALIPFPADLATADVSVSLSARAMSELEYKAEIMEGDHGRSDDGDVVFHAAVADLTAALSTLPRHGERGRMVTLDMSVRAAALAVRELSNATQIAEDNADTGWDVAENRSDAKCYDRAAVKIAAAVDALVASVELDGFTVTCESCSSGSLLRSFPERTPAGRALATARRFAGSHSRGYCHGADVRVLAGIGSFGPILATFRGGLDLDRFPSHAQRDIPGPCPECSLPLVRLTDGGVCCGSCDYAPETADTEPTPAPAEPVAPSVSCVECGTKPATDGNDRCESCAWNLTKDRHAVEHLGRTDHGTQDGDSRGVEPARPSWTNPANNIGETEDEQEATPTLRYVAGWNMPGYLPESDPETFDTFAEAVAYLDGALERIADDPDEADGTAIDAGAARNYFASCISQDERRSTEVGSCVYWIEPTNETED